MKLIDLHCDTLYKSVVNNIPLDDKAMEVDLNQTDFTNILQCFAIWLPDDLSGEKAKNLFFKAATCLKAECDRCKINLLSSFSSLEDAFINNQRSAFFTVENGKALNSKIENVKKFAELGVKMMTLTWNMHNEIGDGAGVENPKGITDFGKNVISAMEENNIVVDISHASDELFYDVAELATKPFVASHSNSRKITAHKRNLTDEQFKIICDNGGIVGLNFHNAFLNNTPEKANMYDIIKHTEHFLSLGGENVISIGSDFDGGTLPYDISGSRSLSKIYELFLQHNYQESLVDKIFFKNSLKFFENFDN
jgi:membrane dipeptidase